jgi:hypothetical protein
MTTLDQLLTTDTPPTLEELRDLWLVFGAEYLPTLEAAQDPASPLKVAPVPLNDGRFFLSADLLSEISGGIFTSALSQLDPSNFPAVQILTTAELEPLRIQPDPQEDP